ncbi:MAG: amidohydrolase family protein [Firmicutes bacterium]|nr:amidohydrolase family protein [Bacillota bacterium]
MIEKHVLKGNIIYTPQIGELIALPDSFILIENGLVTKTSATLPEEWSAAPIHDYGASLLLPGLTDLHIHAPQYAFRGLGLDMELLSWLDAYAFPEEARYADTGYATFSYSQFADSLRKSFTCRANIFATIHNNTAAKLAELIAKTGLYANIGKVSMDRNCPAELNEGTAALTAAAAWILEMQGRYDRVKPIITPRFIPSCSGPLLAALGQMTARYALPVQSHLSESLKEISLVRRLEPQSRHYADAYYRYGLLGGQPTVMAHCVHLSDQEKLLLKEHGVFIAHCPQSNSNLISGAAPIRSFLRAELKVGLATDMAGGAHMSLLRAMQDAVTVSKLRAALIGMDEEPLSLLEAFYLASKGGGAFFGKVGSFEPGYEADVLVINDAELSPLGLTLGQRLERVIYLADERHLQAKYVAGKEVLLTKDN